MITGVLNPTSNYKHSVIDLHNCDEFAMRLIILRRIVRRRIVRPPRKSRFHICLPHWTIKMILLRRNCLIAQNTANILLSTSITHMKVHEKKTSPHIDRLRLLFSQVISDLHQSNA